MAEMCISICLKHSDKFFTSLFGILCVTHNSFLFFDTYVCMCSHACDYRCLGTCMYMCLWRQRSMLVVLLTCSILDIGAVSLSDSCSHWLVWLACLLREFSSASHGSAGIIGRPTWPPSFHVGPGNANFCLCSCTARALAEEPYSQARGPTIPQVDEGCSVVAFKTKLLFQTTVSINTFQGSSRTP